VLAIFLASLAVFSVLAYITVNPKPAEGYFQIYVLGADHRLEQYYPNGNSTIQPNATVTWYLGVTNYMDSAQYAVLELKLGNSSTTPPNDNRHTPSHGLLLTQYSRVLLQNETWEFPFTWEIVGENQTGTALSLTLNTNGTIVPVPQLKTQNGVNFRFIIEIWVYNPTTGALEYGWVSNSQRQAAWLQVWFNATVPFTPSG
jgi:hypothetical protein